MTELIQKLTQSVLEKTREAGELALDIDEALSVLDRTCRGWKSNEQRMIQLTREIRKGDVSWSEYLQTLHDLVQQERRGMSGQGH